MKPRISVVMAVYNGRKYLKEQLDSIISQTVCIDEIIVIDDHSTETSRDIVDSYKGIANCEVKYIEHKENRGYAQTFFEALQLSTGDYILFSDQDDIWMESKVESCLEKMINNPEILCLSTCNILIDSNGKEFGREKNHKDGYIRIKVHDLLKQTGLRPGMTLMITKGLKEKVNQIDTISYEAHDRLIEYLAAIENGFFLIGEYLNKYRIHDANTSGLNRSHTKLRSGKQGRIRQIDKEIRYLKLIRSISKENCWYIEKLIRYYSIRKNLLQESNVLKYTLGSVRILYGYSTYKIWFGDLLAIVRG